MCQITITSVNGTPTGGGLDLLVQGTSTNCKNIIVRVFCQGTWISSPILNVNPANGNWQHTFQGLNCQCGEGIEIEACCVDENGEKIPECQCGFWGGSIPCEGDDCCLDFNIQTQIGDCDNQGKRQVTFTVSFVVNDASCLPYVIYMDFGNGNNSAPQVINSIGPQTLTFTELYDTNIALNYTVTIHHTLPSNCPPQTLNLSLQPCPPVDCCPDITAQINVKNCNDDCKREVEVVTTFTPPNPNCPYASMQWEYYDSNNNFIQYGQSFNNLMTSPHIDTLFLSSTLSPVTAILKIANPPLDCPDIVKTITIPDCGGCPNISSFTHSVKDCVKRADKCCRKVEFEIKGSFCGNPKIRIEYGDGNYDEQIIQNSGQQTIIFDNEYCTGGNYNVKLKVVNPTGCPDQNLTINVPACDPSECNPIVDPEPPEPFCPCCIWLLLTIVIYFVLWALGVYQEQITVLGQTLNVGAFAGGIFGILIILATLCFLFNPKCDCPKCRIAKCTMWAAIIAMVIILILLAFGVAPQWLWALITAFLLFLTALGIHNSDSCKKFWKTGECD